MSIFGKFVCATGPSLLYPPSSFLGSADTARKGNGDTLLLGAGKPPKMSTLPHLS